jgi:hypothetical protein
LNAQERAAIEAVAKQFSATWEAGGDPPDARLLVDGKRVAVDIRTLKQRGRNQATAEKPRLRFDRVVIRLIEHLQATVGATVPAGTTVLLTVTAPIRLPAKTASALEDKIQTLLGRGAPQRDLNDTVHGNDVRIRLLRDGPERAPKMIGFVHNPETAPLQLFDVTSKLLDLFSVAAGWQMPKIAGERWLVAISARSFSCLEACRYILSQLSDATGYEKVLMVFSDGRVGVLAPASDLPA